jgi:predicted amidohydrolase YtcJ
MEVFLRAGFSHIRDVGGCLRHWELASELEREGKLNLFVEMFFNLDDIGDLSEKIKEILESRTRRSEYLRVGGLKLFYDGALGSDGAYLSQNYPGQDHCGLRLLELSKIEEILHRCWEKNIPVAIHTLGDEAVHQVVQVANRLKERGIEGKLNLEHCEVVRDETINLMKSLNVHCHLQPSHFIEDRRWLRHKLGNLYQYCFPWKKLIEASIPVSFGSDSPIEEPSLKKTKEALLLAQEEEIDLPPLREPLVFHSHPDSNWGGHCITNVKGENMEIEISLI